MAQKTRKPEPDQLYVTLVDPRGGYVELRNDNVTTAREEDHEDQVTILQPRVAFRGFIGSLTELLGYKIENAYGVWVDETGFAREEEMEGGAI